MEVTKLTQEAFDIPSVRTAYLKDKGDSLSVSTATAGGMSRSKYEDMFNLVQYGTEIFDARLFSPELLWNDVKLMDVPVGWPNSTTVENEVERQKKMHEYTRLVRSLTDPTKAMIKYAQSPNVLEYIDQQTLQPPYSWVKVTHELLMLFYNLFGGFSTREEALAWREINAPTGE